MVVFALGRGIGRYASGAEGHLIAFQFVNEPLLERERDGLLLNGDGQSFDEVPFRVLVHVVGVDGEAVSNELVAQGYTHGVLLGDDCLEIEHTVELSDSVHLEGVVNLVESIEVDNGTGGGVDHSGHGVVVLFPPVKSADVNVPR